LFFCDWKNSLSIKSGKPQKAVPFLKQLSTDFSPGARTHECVCVLLYFVKTEDVEDWDRVVSNLFCYWGVTGLGLRQERVKVYAPTFFPRFLSSLVFLVFGKPRFGHTEAQQV